MWFGVDELLRQPDVGDLFNGDHQAKVYTLEQEDSAVLEAAVHRRLADECPLAAEPALAAVLQRRAWGQVALQKRLRTMQEHFKSIRE